MNIKKITILTGRNGGSDEVILDTDLTPSQWPWTMPAPARVTVAAGHGVKWVEENFGDAYLVEIRDCSVMASGILP